MKSQLTYRTPTDDEMTADLPRLVNDRWLILALRDQARAVRAGTWLPWQDAQLLTRAANRIEQLLKNQRGRKP
jgi:hypothetical protein